MFPHLKIVLVLVGLLILAGVLFVVFSPPLPIPDADATASANSPMPFVQSPPTITSAPATTCHISNGLPDQGCTPGVANPNVTQTNIGSTICVSGFTSRIRPPAAYTDALKIQQMQAYGLGGSTADYEEDHLIPLEVGGDPRDPRNLWPQPRGGQPNAGEKDRFENYLHREICAGRLQLVDAQHAIASDWVSAWIAAGRP